MRKTITILFVLLAFITTISFMVGCSDMMEKLGEISLSVELDTPTVEVASYTLDVAQPSRSTSFRVSNITPPRHTLSSLSKGTWKLTVTAFDGDGIQIGIGSQVVDLREGQIANVTVLVVFGQSAPLSSAFSFEAPNRYDSPLGAICGTTATMEYKLGSASEETPYTTCSSGSTALAPGVYVIRYAQAHGLKASEGVTVTVPSYQPIQLTIAAPELTTTKVYDGTTALSAIVNIGTHSGVLEGDEVTVQGSGSYDCAQAGDRTITVTYSISGADAPNYLAPVDTTHEGTIEKKQLAITAPTLQLSKEYDRSTTVAISAVGELSGVLEKDEVLPTASAAYSDATAGTGKPVTVTYALSGRDANNYSAPVSAIYNIGTITKKQLTVTGTTIASKVYDGNTTATLSSAGTLGGLIGGDSVTLGGTATFANETVGTGKPVTVTYALSGRDANNYSAPVSATYNIGTITKKQLTATVGDYSRVYGETNPSFPVSVTGFVNGENASTAAGYVAATASTVATSTTGVGTYTITITGGSATNYSFDSSDTGTLTITKKQLTVTGATIASKVYDGDTNATLSSAGTLGGLIGADSVTLQATVAFADTTVGTGKPVTVTYALSGRDANNYSAPESAIYNIGTITKKQLTVTGTTIASKVYDGNTTATLSSAGTLGGLIDGDSVTLGGTATFANETVGTGKPATVTYALSGRDANNYSAPVSATYNIGTITKKQLTATVGDYSRVYGETNPSFPVSVTGFVNGENASTAAGYVAATASTVATSTTGVGTYTITITGGSATNYSFDSSDTGTLTITKAVMTGTVSVSGIAAVGKVLTASTTLTNSGTPTYQWKRDGNPISGATGNTYTLTQHDIGSSITVTVTASGSNYQGSVTSAETEPVTKVTGLSLSGTISAYYPSLPATQTIINLTGFTANLAGLEAQVAPNGTAYGSYADIEIDSRGRAMILMPSAVTTAAKVRLRYKETDIAYVGAEREISVGEQALAVGDYYSGGIVAYFFGASDPGYVSGQLHGLIAAKADSSAYGSKWSSAANYVEIGTAVGIGTGLTNTNKIIEQLDRAGEVGLYAAQEARSYTDGIFDDWFLPSRDELRKLRDNRLLIGNFGIAYPYDYMSSSESTQSNYSPALYYHVVLFNSNTAEWVSSKDYGTHIRPVRYF